MRRVPGVLAVAILLAARAAFADPFWGARQSKPAGTDPTTLAPGEFVWEGASVPSGPIVVVVSLAEQRAYVYRNGIEIGVSTASTGRPGHRTPTGVFVVLQKDKEHHSKTYNNAPMPYAERLTWDGVALHAGGLPGYPSSHGCIHLPTEFAKLLFEVSPMGMTVVLADQRSAPADVVHPPAIAPVDAATGKEDEERDLAAGEAARWQPDASPTGPVSIVMSGADRRVLVFRNGKEIGRAPLVVKDPSVPLGTHAFIMLEGKGQGASSFDASTPRHRWIAVGIPGHAGEDARPLDPAQADRITVPKQFGSDVYAILEPGATLLVTDAPILEETTGPSLNIINADDPGGGSS